MTSARVDDVLGSPVVSRIVESVVRGTRILACHGVESREQFDRNLAMLTRHYDIVDPIEYTLERSARGLRPSVVLTFDDGWASTVEFALPALRERGVTAAMFVCPGIVEGGGAFWWDIIDAAERAGLAARVAPDIEPHPTLVTALKAVPDAVRLDVVDMARTLLDETFPKRAASEDQLGTWLEAGMTVGNHTWNHPCLDRCGAREQRSQVEQAHRWLTTFVGQPPRLFAYPNGDWAPHTEEALRDFGYDAAFLFDHAVADDAGHPLRRSRLRADADASTRRLRAIASGSHSTVFAASAQISPRVRRAVPRHRADADRQDNLDVFDSPELASAYAAAGGLTTAERALVDRWIPPGASILDLGVGNGRTYPALSALASEYLGSDYAPEMVEAARRHFSSGSFDVIDAVDLGRFDNESFDAVVFSYNGLDYIQPRAQREQALREISRVLAPGGVFIGSSHNSRAILHRPALTGSPGSISRNILIAVYASARSVRSLLFSTVFWAGCGDQLDRIRPLLTHYTTPKRFADEIAASGLTPVQSVGADHPRRLRVLVSPWTYIAAVKPPDPNMQTHVARGEDAWKNHATIWDELARRSEASIFQTRQWAESWRAHFAPGCEPIMISATRPDGDIVGLLPMARLDRRVHRRVALSIDYLGLAGSGRGAGEHLGPITDDPAVAALLLRRSADEAGASTLYLENLDRRWEGTAMSSCGGMVVKSTVCPVSTRSSNSSFGDRWSKKVRKNDRRRQRKLSDNGIAPRWIFSSSLEFADALVRLQAVHRLRWQMAGTEGLFDDDRVGFLLDLANRFEPPAGPVILLLERDGVAVAGLYGLVCGTTFSVYKTGWHPDFVALGLGLALGTEAMRWAEANGLTTFDYLRGHQSHKADLGCEPIADPSVMVARGLRGGLLMLRERWSSDGVRPVWWQALR